MPARGGHVSNSEGMLPRSSLASHSIGKDAVPLPPSRRAEKPKAQAPESVPTKTVFVRENSEGQVIYLATNP